MKRSSRNITSRQALILKGEKNLSLYFGTEKCSRELCFAFRSSVSSWNPWALQSPWTRKRLECSYTSVTVRKYQVTFSLRLGLYLKLEADAQQHKKELPFSRFLKFRKGFRICSFDGWAKWDDRLIDKWETKWTSFQEFFFQHPLPSVRNEFV